MTLEEPSISTKDVKVPVIKARALHPDALFIPTYQVFPHYMREIAALHWQVPIYSVELDQALLDQSDQAANGVVFVRPAPAVATFVEKFKQRYKVASDLPSAQCYDAFKILLQGVRHVGQDAGDLEKYFANLENYAGASGLIGFKNGRTIMPIEWCSVRDRKVSNCSKEPKV